MTNDFETLIVAVSAALLLIAGGAGVVSADATDAGSIQANETNQTNETVQANETVTTDVTFENQTSNGSTVTVQSASLAEGGFVAVHGNFGYVLGTSEYLEPGEHENVTVDVNQSELDRALLNESEANESAGNQTGVDLTDANATGDNVTEEGVRQMLAAAAHHDSNDNEEFDYVATQGANDSVYEVNDTMPVSDSAFVTFEQVTIPANQTENATADQTDNVPDEGPTPNETNATQDNETAATNESDDGGEAAIQGPANVTFTDTTVENGTVVVDSVALPEEGGFVALMHANETIEVTAEYFERIGHSEYLESGVHENVTVQLDESQLEQIDNETVTLAAIPHQDSNSNQQWDYDETNGSADEPYFFQGASISKMANVTLQNTTGEAANATGQAAQNETTPAAQNETEQTTENETVTENATAPAAQNGTNATAQNGTDQATENETAGEVDETYVLDGVTAGWEGLSPESIEGESNPTLVLEPGNTYNITWINSDGAPHNIVITDAQGSIIERTEVISGVGRTQTLIYNATGNSDTYYCEVHPSSMRADTTSNGSAA